MLEGTWIGVHGMTPAGVKVDAVWVAGVRLCNDG